MAVALHVIFRFIYKSFDGLLMWWLPFNSVFIFLFLILIIIFVLITFYTALWMNRTSIETVLYEKHKATMTTTTDCEHTRGKKLHFCASFILIYSKWANKWLNRLRSMVDRKTILSSLNLPFQRPRSKIEKRIMNILLFFRFYHYYTNIRLDRLKIFHIFVSVP